ncbi:hypothetical protein Zm00014a_017095 [Zea mays]|uniref:Uncharacterized protein n=1 Tax=Zea mays TaxID=4577 RepID=A0A3L6FRE1_MAIZE|nr:hypothetical protein Zm00014a_017095 [Zea mays]
MYLFFPNLLLLPINYVVFKSIMLSYVELVLLFSTIIPTYLILYSYIFLYLYISKASPRLTRYCLKG